MCVSFLLVVIHAGSFSLHDTDSIASVAITLMMNFITLLLGLVVKTIVHANISIKKNNVIKKDKIL